MRDPQNRLWHGVNLVALTHRARADGIGNQGLARPSQDRCQCDCPRTVRKPARAPSSGSLGLRLCR